MSRNLTASDRKSLIRLASSLPKGSEERRAILAGLAKLSPEDAEWFKGHLRDLAKRVGGRVLKDTDTSFWFTYPKNPAVKKVVFTGIDRDKVLFWIENQDGAQGTGWDEWRRVVHDPSNHVNLKVLLGRDPSVWDRDFISSMKTSLLVDLDRVFLGSGKPTVEGVVERRDLKPSSRGWSTNPNTYGEPTYYEVQGTGLDKPNAEVEIVKWLKSNRPDLEPGRHEHGYGAYDDVSLSWDRRENAWMIVKRFSYTGG